MYEIHLYRTNCTYRTHCTIASVAHVANIARIVRISGSGSSYRWNACPCEDGDETSWIFSRGD
ncbi:hypothetical protein HGO21_10630 [Acinetobacter sp. CUI P1]|nr:hypothetical protein [Acinetobacter sp. CUI P1]